MRQGIWLEFITLAWNVAGALVILVAAYRANSIALAGFGLDSLIEIAASIVVIWNLTGAHTMHEKKAMRLISLAFWVLVFYVAIQSVRALYLQLRPAISIPGVLWLIATFLLMLTLAAAKHRVGNKLNNAVLLTEAKVTLVDAYLAASVLLGVTLNAILGWWWADPIAGLVLVFYGIKEGRHAWQESKRSCFSSP